MLNLEQLTCNPSQSAELVSLGIAPAAFLWHSQEERPHTDTEKPPVIFWDTCLFKTPQPGEKVRPAWTKEELDILIGPDIGKPDLYPKHLLSRASDPLHYPIMLPTKMVEFASGAQASAYALIYLIKKEIVDVALANARYSKKFNR